MLVSSIIHVATRVDRLNESGVCVTPGKKEKVGIVNYIYVTRKGEEVGQTCPKHLISKIS